MSEITEKTLIPISLVIALVGGISFVTSVSNRTDGIALGQQQIRQEMVVNAAVVDKMREDSAVIREQLAGMRADLKQVISRLERLR